LPKSKAEFNIFLIGFMGTGKSTVGKILAKKLGWKFVDSDIQIERVSKNKISRIIDEQGIRTFRKIESQVISKICKNNNQVVALGGGSVLSPTNRKMLRSAGIMVELEAKTDTLIKRLRHSHDRPLIRAVNIVERAKKIDQLYRKRRKHYKMAASEKFATDLSKPNAVATRIQKYMIGLAL
jgi:shikimate kinase